MSANNSNPLTIFKPENVSTITNLAPKSFEENSLSRNRCLDAGRQLLQRVQQEEMSDALDLEIAKFIEKAKATVKKMNGKRSPVTQLFDQIRKAYTSMENDVDPSKSDTIPYQLQLARNAYAKKKYEEEERRRREEAALIAKKNAKNSYRTEVENDYARQFNILVNNRINALLELDRQVTLKNFNSISTQIKNFDCQFPDEWCQGVVCNAYHPVELSSNECQAIQANVLATMLGRFAEQFTFEMESTRDEILDRLPSKKIELQRIAETDAENAARIKAEMEAREKAEAARKETERIDREKQAAAEAALNASKQEMDSLFGLPVAAPIGYQPKAQVKQLAVVETPEDIMAIVGFWWSQEGCNRSMDELKKEFKKQINFANAAANSKNNPMFISNIRYVENIKAK